MNKRVAQIALAVTTLAVASLHLAWVPHDNGHLLIVGSQPVDVMGEVQARWNQVIRQCRDVQRVSPHAGTHADALATIMRYSPPQSESARIVSLWASGEWLLAEVEFQALFPAVVLIRTSTPRFTVVPQAVWSGVTKPWKAAPHIRNYLMKQPTGAPAELFRCFEPQSDHF